MSAYTIEPGFAIPNDAGVEMDRLVASAIHRPNASYSTDDHNALYAAMAWMRDARKEVTLIGAFDRETNGLRWRAHAGGKRNARGVTIAEAIARAILLAAGGIESETLSETITRLRTIPLEWGENGYDELRRLRNGRNS